MRKYFLFFEKLIPWTLVLALSMTIVEAVAQEADDFEALLNQPAATPSKKQIAPLGPREKKAPKSATTKKQAPRVDTKKLFETQIAELENMLKKEPDDIELHSQIGFLYMQSQQYEKAVQSLKRAAVNSSVKNMLMLADAYRKTGDHLNEIRALEVLEQKNPIDPEIHELLGRAYFETKNMEKSAVYYRKALAIDKKRTSAYDGLYEVFTKTNNNYERREVLQDMLEAFGDTAEVHTKMCRFLSQDSFYDKAIQHCKKAIELNSKIPENHVFLGMNYKGRGELGQAAKIIQQAAKNFSKSEFAQYAAGLINDDLKNWETATYYYARGTKADPESDRCFLGLAQGKLQTADYGEALTAFAKACSLNRAHYMAFRNAASTVRMKKKTDWIEKFQTESEKCGTPKSSY